MDETHLLRAIRTLIGLIEPEMGAEGLGRLSGNQKKVDELVTRMMSTRGLGYTSQDLSPEEGGEKMKEDSSSYSAATPDPHVAMCALKDLLRRFCKMPKALCVRLVEMEREGRDDEADFRASIGRLLSTQLSASRMELFSTLFRFLKDVHLVQTGEEGIETILKKRRNETGDLEEEDSSSMEIGSSATLPRGRGVKAMDCNNLGRVFAPALMSWQDGNETQTSAGGMDDKGLKDLVVLVEAFTSVVAQLIMWSPSIWRKDRSSKEEQEATNEAEEGEGEEGGSRKRKRRHRRGLLQEEEDAADLQGKETEEQKLISADVNYIAGVSFLSRMMVVKLRHRMLLPLSSKLFGPSSSHSPPSRTTEMEKEKEHQKEEKNKRLRIDEQGHASSSSSSISSSSGSSLSTLSGTPTLQSVYADLKYQALIRFRQAAELGHIASSVELARLVFFGFLEDQEISSVSAIASSSAQASMAAKEVEDLEPDRVDTSSELVVNAYLQVVKSALRTLEDGSYDNEALLIASRATVADVLDFVNAMEANEKMEEEEEKRKREADEKEDEVLLSRKRAISSPQKPSLSSSFASLSPPSSTETLLSCPTLTYCPVLEDEEGEQQAEGGRKRATTLDDSCLTNSSPGSSILLPSLSVLSGSRIGYERCLLQSHLSVRERRVLGNRLSQLADVSTSISTTAALSSTLQALREGVSRRSIYEKRKVKLMEKEKKQSEPFFYSTPPSSPSVQPSLALDSLPTPSELRKEDWKDELFLDLIGSGSIPMLLPGTPSEEAKFIAALAGACAEILSQRERKKEEEEEAAATSVTTTRVFGIAPDLQVATDRLRGLLKHRPHVVAQAFFTGPLAELLFESASLSFATGDRNTFESLASLASDASQPDASFALALHHLAEFERLSRKRRGNGAGSSIIELTENTENRMEEWKSCWDSVRFLWKAKGQGHPRARFLLFDLCPQITSIAQCIYRTLYPNRQRQSASTNTNDTSTEFNEEERAWLLELTIKLFLCAALSSSRFSACAPPLTPQLSSLLLLPGKTSLLSQEESSALSLFNSTEVETLSPKAKQSVDLLQSSYIQSGSGSVPSSPTPVPLHAIPQSPSNSSFGSPHLLLKRLLRGSVQGSAPSSPSSSSSRISRTKLAFPNTPSGSTLTRSVKPSQRAEAIPSGQAEAEFALGYLHEYGIGVTKDERLAEGWYRRSAIHNCPKASNNLGLLLFRRHQAKVREVNGAIPSTDSELRVIPVLDEAVTTLEAGVRLAEDNLAQLLEQDSGVSSSFDFFELPLGGKSASQDVMANGNCEHDLGSTSLSVTGWRKWLSGLLCNLGLINDEEAKNGGLDKPKVAKQLYKRAAELGNPEAMANLSLLYLSGRALLPTSSSSSFATTNLADKVTDSQRKKALKYMQKSADAGTGIAHYYLSMWYESGTKVVGGKKDPYRAMYHCQQAVSSGFTPNTDQIARQLASVHAKYDIQISAPVNLRQAAFGDVISSLLDNYSQVAQLDRAGMRRAKLASVDGQALDPTLRLGPRTALSSLPVLRPKPSSPSTTPKVSAKQVREFLRAKKKFYGALLDQAEITLASDLKELERSKDEIRDAWASELVDFEKHLVAKLGQEPAAGGRSSFSVSNKESDAALLVMLQVEAEKREMERTTGFEFGSSVEGKENTTPVPSSVSSPFKMFASASKRLLMGTSSSSLSTSSSSATPQAQPRKWQQEKERLERECLRCLSAQVVDHAVLEASESNPLDISLEEREICIQTLMKHRHFRYTCLSSMVTEVEPILHPEDGTSEDRYQKTRRGMDFEKRMLLASMIATLLQQEVKFKRRTGSKTSPNLIEKDVLDVLDKWKAELAVYRV